MHTAARGGGFLATEATKEAGARSRRGSDRLDRCFGPDEGSCDLLGLCIGHAILFAVVAECSEASRLPEGGCTSQQAIQELTGPPHQFPEVAVAATRARDLEWSHPGTGRVPATCASFLQSDDLCSNEPFPF